MGCSPVIVGDDGGNILVAAGDMRDIKEAKRGRGRRRGRAGDGAEERGGSGKEGEGGGHG
jgi:hypothetical protein